MRGRNAVLAVAVTVALGALGAGAAIASDHENSRDHDSGYVIPGASGGVNPAYHPEYFGSPADSACFERFKTYDRVTGTYLGRDGRRRPCRAR